MLVVVDRHTPPGSAEDGDDLFEEPSPRVEVLALPVVRVIAVLADEEDAVHGQPIAAERQCVPHGARQPDAVPRRHPPADIGLG